MKTPRVIQLAEEYCSTRPKFSGHSIEEADAFHAGYKAAQNIILEELKIVQANKTFSEFVERPCVESVLHNLLDKLGEV